MTSFELIKAIEKFIEGVARNSVLMKALENLSVFHNKMLSGEAVVELRSGVLDKFLSGMRALIGLSERYASMDMYDSEVRDTKQRLQITLKANWSRKLFSDIENLEATIAEVQRGVATNDGVYFIHLKRQLEDFATTYEDFIKEREIDTLGLLRKAHELYRSILTGVEALSAVQESLAGNKKETSDSKLLDIFLHPDGELAVIIIKLKSLDIIYSELCRLLNVSNSEHPLKVVKLETGSLWAKLFGESKVITLMTDLVRSAVGFIYRNFTKEGRMSSIPMNVEELESVLNLEQRMREIGLDTTDMRESIRISGVVIAKQLNNLLTGEAVVTINDERLSVGSEVEKFFIEKSKTLLLEEGASESTQQSE